MARSIHDESARALMETTYSGKAMKTATLAEMEVDLMPSSVSYHSFGTLMKLAFLAILPNLGYVLLLFTFYIAMGVFIGILYSGIGYETKLIDENTQCIFYSVAFTIIIGILPTVITFPQQMAEFTRENNGKHSTLAFYLAQTLIDLPLLVLVSSIYAFLVFNHTQRSEWARMTIFLIFCTLTTLISYSIALLVAVELSDKSNTARASAALAIVVPLAALGGFWVPFLFPFSYVRYAYEGALIGIIGRYDHFQCPESYCENDKDSDVVLRGLSMNELHLSIDVEVLVFTFFALQAFTIVSLHCKNKSDRFKLFRQILFHIFLIILAICYVFVICTIIWYMYWTSLPQL